MPTCLAGVCRGRGWGVCGGVGGGVCSGVGGGGVCVQG